jgi:hypothetical protein
MTLQDWLQLLIFDRERAAQLLRLQRHLFFADGVYEFGAG